MNLHFCPRLAALALAACTAAAPLATAGQDAPAAAVVEQLNRVGANLFSAAPRPAEAIEELKALLAVDPGLAEAHLLLGIAYRAEGSTERLGEAVAELRQAIALKPSLLMARLTLARVYLDMARASRAREELESALEEAPGRPEILSLLGEAERRLGNPRRSADLNRDALESDAAFAQARYYLGLALLDLRQYAGAIRELQLVVRSGANPVEANLALGTAFLEAGRPAEALPPLQEAARLAPANPEIHIRLARTFRTRKAFARADQELALAERHLEAAIGTLYHDLESDLHMEEGLLRMAQGRLEPAAAAFQRVLALNANHEAARQGLAEVRKRQQPAGSRKPGGAP